MRLTQLRFLLMCVLAISGFRLHAWQSDNGNGIFMHWGEQSNDGLNIDLPAKNPNDADYPYVLKLTFDGKIPALDGKQTDAGTK